MAGNPNNLSHNTDKVTLKNDLAISTKGTSASLKSSGFKLMMKIRFSLNVII